ncbi:MAG: hypothetical protein EBT12_15060 [Marivivens sp.]|nr:hypothetical protein [Marivivens sp.]
MRLSATRLRSISSATGAAKLGTDIFLLTQSNDNLITQSGDLIFGSAIVAFLLTQSNDNLVTQLGDLMFGMGEA